MGTTSDEALHDYVAARYRDLRRSAFLMCGDWALADELTRTSLARLVADAHRDGVHDPDAYVYSDLMAAFQHRPARREHVFLAGPDPTSGTARGAATARDAGAADRQMRTVLVLDALHHLAPRCRAVLVLRHGTGFTVDETADVLGLADERVEAYEAAGLAALGQLLPKVAAR
ncbi:MAG TPA: sigma factor-like helix-turn-helix DNA-binding protein [Actinoplanes sp.]|nr:sigma factor-like helix-turn-helix DNA-binding protein [Actinoplanes sp.]